MAINGLPRLLAQMQFPAEAQHLILQRQQLFSLFQTSTSFQGIFLYVCASESHCFISQGTGRVGDLAETFGSQVPSLLYLPGGVTLTLGLLIALSTGSTQLGAASQGSGWL